MVAVIQDYIHDMKSIQKKQPRKQKEDSMMISSV
jgi:hypothetical protein